MGKVVFREPDREGLSAAGFLGVDMHFHSDKSFDSLARIDHALRRAKKLGIGIAFTDHNETSAGVKFFRNTKNVFVIPGIELTSSEGTHTLLYFSTARACQEFTSKVLKPLKRKDPFKLPITTEDLYESAKRHQAVVCAPHPFGPGVTGVHKIRITRAMERSLDCVEGVNAYATHEMNAKAVRWADRLKKPITGGSDGHLVAELGQALTFCQSHDVHEFLDELRRGHCIAMGRENSLYEKAIVGVEKEESFVGRARKHHEGAKLVKDQLGVEWSYLKQRVKKGWMHEEHKLFRAHHG